MRSFLMVLTFVFAFAPPADGALSDCIDATCRLRAPDGGTGTGCVFEVSQGRVFVITNRHVVGDASTMQCVFWRRGHQSMELPGEVLVRSPAVDVAVVTLPAAAFGRRPPRAVPIAPRATQLVEGQTLTSVGCARGAWATGWKGHVSGYAGENLCFTPPPADGRSGSALFDEQGTRIVGLIWGRDQREGRGYAVPVQNLYRALNFSETSAGGWRHSPLPTVSFTPAQCGPGGCPAPYLLPYRRFEERYQNLQDQRIGRLEDREMQPQGVWPTLPPNVELRIGQQRPQLPDAPPPSVEQEPPRSTGDGGMSGLGVALTLAAALGVGIFLFYVVGKQ